MPTPTKPYLVLASEKKSHRTKKELKQREQGEKSLDTGIALQERPEVKENPISHREFLRVTNLLEGIDKNDSLYEAIINRYCEIQAECVGLKEQRELYRELITGIRSTFKELTCDMGTDERAMLLINLTKALGQITNSIDKIDGKIQTKRKMLLDIEKENIFTIAAALRSIPKKTENKTNALLEALGGD